MLFRSATQDKYGFQGGASQPDPGERRCAQPQGETPQSEGGTGQNAPKTGPNRPKMRFGAIFHLKAIFIHFGPFEKVEKFSILTSFGRFLAIFGAFLAISAKSFGGFPPFAPMARRQLLSGR